MKVVAKIEGLTETLAALHGLKQGMRNRIQRKAFTAGAKPIVKAARQLVPERTRQMKKALGVKVKTFPSGVVVALIGVRKGFRVVIDGKPVDPAKYLHLVLFGRAAVEIDATNKRLLVTTDPKFSVVGGIEGAIGRHAISPAAKGNNFLAAAYEAAKGECIGNITRVVQEELAKYRAKGKI